MLKRSLVICALALSGFIGVQAEEPIERESNAGILLCDDKEDNCTRDMDQESLLSVNEDEDGDEETQLFACKHCGCGH